VASCLVLLQELLDLGIDRGLEHSLGPLANDLVQRTALIKLPAEFDDFRIKLLCLWLSAVSFRTLTHGVSSCPRRAAEVPKSSAGYAAFFHPASPHFSHAVATKRRRPS
jgi:hypothetical protein